MALLFLSGGHVVRKLEPIQFPYFGVGKRAFRVGGVSLGDRYSMSYAYLIGLLKLVIHRQGVEP